MIKWVGKLFGSLVRTILLGLVLLGGLVAALYAWYASSQLQKTLRAAQVKEGYAVEYDVVRGRYAKVETGWPATVRAFVKETGAHNWVPTETRGLVRTVLQWSPDQNRWVEEPQESLPLEQRARLEAMIRVPVNGGLIDALLDENRWTREVAFRELRLRTGETFGYQPDGPEEARQEAVARWKKWWEENKTQWATEKVLDKVKEILR